MMRKTIATIAALCATVLVAACGGQSTPPAGSGDGAKSTIQLRLPVAAPTSATTPIFVGAEKGFFAEEGFQTSYVTVASAAAMVPAITAGQIDVMTASLSTEIGMRQAGQDVQVISGYTIGQNYFVFVRNGVNIPANGTFEEKMKALNGLRIGAQGGAEGTVVPLLKAVMKAGGGDPATLQFANMAFGGPQIAGLQGSQVDVVLADDATVSTGTNLGIGTSVFSLLKDSPPEYTGLLGSGVAALSSTLTKYPDFNERYFRAMDKTFKWMQDPANMDEIVKIATTVQGLPNTPDLPKRLAAFVPTLSAGNDKTTVQRSLDFLFESGQVKPEPEVTVDQFFNPVMVMSG
ncbi:MAG: hypothetical protein ABS81_00575 [Pseudonocardia sp. SCN 72-86]|nr:MAG: hypothetical protein ABS81_00575 [Pseudonocardia sp. SCN 72-86]